MTDIKTDNTETLVNALEEIGRLQGRVSELEQALQPFAKEAEFVPERSSELRLVYQFLDAQIDETTEFSAHDFHVAKQALISGRTKAEELEAGGGDE